MNDDPNKYDSIGWEEDQEPPHVSFFKKHPVYFVYNIVYVLYLFVPMHRIINENYLKYSWNNREIEGVITFLFPIFILVPGLIISSLSIRKKVVLFINAIYLANTIIILYYLEYLSNIQYFE